MLYSDSGVMLPGVWKLPPSTSSRFSAPVRRGSCSSAIAALVSGPVVTSVISPGLAITVSMMKSTACPGVAWRDGRRRRRIEFLQPVAETGDQPLLEMHRRLHVGLGIADDRPPGAGVDRDIVAPGQRQRVEDDIGDLFDRAGGTGDGGDAFEPDIRVRRGKQHGENIVAGRIHVEDYAFH